MLSSERILRGAEALEQRLDSVPSNSCNSAQVTLNMTKKEDTQMTENNTSDAPKRKIKVLRSNAFLAALHVLVLAISLALHPPVKLGTVGALP